MSEQDNWKEFVDVLDHEDCDCDLSLRYGEGPPVKPLAWPTPTIFKAELISVKAFDHRSNSIRTIDHVLVKKHHGGRQAEKAYLIRKKISKTTFGSVRVGVVLRRRGEDEPMVDEVPWISTEELVALKVSSWNKIRQHHGQQPEDPVREVAALQLVGNQHPHVVGCYEVMEDAKHLYAVMPYYSQGTNLHVRLFSEEGSRRQAMPPPNEDEARSIFRQLLKGLLHLQRKGIFHRDISLDNLLISKTNELQIVDLGMSLRVPYNDSCNEDCITDVSEGTVRRLIKKQAKGGGLMYLAPEIVAEKEAFDGFAVDIWGAGVCLFVLLVGMAPFKTAEPSDKRYAKISSGGLKSLMETLCISLNSGAADLIQNMLWENPNHRLSLLEVMKHPWVMGDPMKAATSPSALDVINEAAFEYASSSSEPMYYESSLSMKASNRSSTQADPFQAIHLADPESRQSASESSESRDYGAEAVHNVNHRLAKNLQQIGPRLKANAKEVGRIGPKLKNAVAHVHIHRQKSGASSSKPTADKQSPSSLNLSPTRRSHGRQQFFSRLKTAIPHRTTSAPTRSTTP